MRKTDESFLFETLPFVCFFVFVACVAAIVILAVRHKRRTGKWSEDAVDAYASSTPLWTFLLWMASSIVHDNLPGALHRLPLNILVPTFDTTMLVGTAVVGGYALSYSFRSDWNWRVGLWQTVRLLFVGMWVSLWISDLGLYSSMRWVWLPAGALAVFFTPYAARIVYFDLVGRTERSVAGERPEPSPIWRP